MDLEIIIYNERIKLLATFVNSVGIALFAIGGLAPVVSALHGTGDATGFLIFVSAICFIVAAALHYVASAILKRMRQ